MDGIFDTLNIDIFFRRRRKRTIPRALSLLPSFLKVVRSLWISKTGQNQRRRRRRRRRQRRRRSNTLSNPSSIEGSRRSLLFFTRGKKTDKIHLSLLLYPSRDKICGLVLFFLEKLFSPLKRTFAVGNLRRDDGGSLLLVGDNFGDDLGAGDLGL